MVMDYMRAELDERDIQGFIDAVGSVHRPVSGRARIVSLVPSVTELVCDLGLATDLVGRTGFCVHPRTTLKPIPKVGGTKDVKVDAIRALEPTHLIVNVDENTRETVDLLARFVPNIIVTHPCTPEDNIALYRLIGGVFGRVEASEKLVGDLQEVLRDAQVVAAMHTPETALYLIWREPWMSVSRKTYISAMLARVGWISLPEEAIVRYPVIDWQSPWVGEVDRVFLSTEPYRFRDRHVHEVAGLSNRPTSLIDGEMVSWYGSRAIAGVRYLIDLRKRLAA